MYQLNDSFRTPAHELRDGVDYVSTDKVRPLGSPLHLSRRRRPHRRPGHRPHLGLGPRIPLGDDRHGLLRRDARLRRPVGLRAQQGTVHRLAVRPLHRQARSELFLIVIFILLLMVIAAFSVVINNLLISTPSAVIPTWGAIGVALLVGVAVYRLRMPLTTRHHRRHHRALCAHRARQRGPRRHPGELPRHDADGLLDPHALRLRRVASLLPVWVLLQPRDYINGVQLFIGLALLYGAVVIGVSSPTVRTRSLRPPST